MAAFQEKLPAYRSQNVQVLGVSADDPDALAKFADDVRVTFPLISDKGGKISKRFGFFDQASSRTVRAVALVVRGRTVFRQQVKRTEVPAHLEPWIDKVVTGGRSA